MAVVRSSDGMYWGLRPGCTELDGTKHPAMPAVKKAVRTTAAFPVMPLLDMSKENITKLVHEIDNEEQRAKYKTGIDHVLHFGMKACMVAELVKDKALRYSKDAMDAADKEWKNLESRECWDLSKVVRWDDVCKRRPTE